MGNKKLFGWLDFGSNILGSVANVISTALTNKSNQRIEAARNAMQIAENEKAYQRSKPTNQVANLQAAGMSKAGALNTLNGGGSYTPASISSSTNQAPQIDLSSAFDGLIQIGENAKQRKLQEDLLDKQISAAEAAQKAQFEENVKQREHELLIKDIDSANQTQSQWLDYQKHLDNLGFEKEKWNYLAPLQKKQLMAVIDNLYLDHDLKESEKRDLIYKINEYQSKSNRDMRDAESLMRYIASKYNYNITQKDFYDYRDKYFMPVYDNGNVISYEPRRLDYGDAAFSYGADRFWSMVGNVIPIEYLGKIIKSLF